MKTNEGTLDRGLRVVLGLVLVGLAETGNAGAWAYVGLVPLLTGTFGYCPVYGLLGIDTCSLRRP